MTKDTLIIHLQGAYPMRIDFFGEIINNATYYFTY